MEQSIEIGIDQISAFERFLTYGPIGIVGLTLLFALIGLLVRDLDERRYSLIKYIIGAGVFSLVALLVAEFMAVDHEHDLAVRISPLDDASQRETFPAPMIIIDQTEVERTQPINITKDTAMIVDVSEAIEALEEANRVLSQVQASNAQATERFTTIAERLEALEQEVSEAQSQAGVETLRLTTGISKSLNEISGDLISPAPAQPAEN